MSPAVVLVLAVGASLSWASSTPGFEPRIAPAVLDFDTNDSYLSVPAVQYDRPAAGACSEWEDVYGDLADFAVLFESDSYLDTFSNWLDDPPDFRNVAVTKTPERFTCRILEPLSDHVANRADPNSAVQSESAWSDRCGQNPHSAEHHETPEMILATLASPSTSFTNSNSERNVERLNVTRFLSASSSLEVVHPESVNSSPPASPVRSDRQRRRGRQSAREPSRRKSVSGCAREIGSGHVSESPNVRQPDSGRSPSGLQPSCERQNSATRNRLSLLYPLLRNLHNVDALQAEAEKHQVDAESSQRSGSLSFIPRLSESVQDRVELFAAHYFTYFGPGCHNLLSESDTHYRRSLECLLLCYYGHCAGDRDAFNRRFPRWGQCSFHISNCHGIGQCSYRVRALGHDPKSGPPKRCWPAVSMSEMFLGRRVHVQQLIRNISLCASDYRFARLLEKPPPGRCVVPRLCSIDGVPMTVVVAHYSRYFGPGAVLRNLHRQDRVYRNSLQCLIVCYFEHFGGVDADFRARYPKLSIVKFYLLCTGKMTCNADFRSAMKRLKS